MASDEGEVMTKRMAMEIVLSEHPGALAERIVELYQTIDTLQAQVYSMRKRIQELTTEWQRTSNLIPETERDGWMDLMRKSALLILSQLEDDE